MKRYTTYLASCAILAFGATAASADCAEELAQLTGEDMTAAAGAEGEISKDGSTAPLETEADAEGEMEAEADAMAGVGMGAGGSGDPAADMGADATAAGDATAATEGDDGDIVKDGSVAPLEEGADGEAGVPDSGDATAIATSPQEVEAQQSGEATATVEAGSDAGQTDAIERARAALAAGDEEACMEALEEARS